MTFEVFFSSRLWADKSAEIETMILSRSEELVLEVCSSGEEDVKENNKKEEKKRNRSDVETKATSIPA